MCDLQASEDTFGLEHITSTALVCIPFPGPPSLKTEHYPIKVSITKKTTQDWSDTGTLFQAS
jgi:hypothetical protein